MDNTLAATLIFISCICFLMVCLLIGGFIYQASKGKVFKHLYHDKLDWHIAKYDLDGRGHISFCTVCGKLIVRTEDGPWIATNK